MKQYAIILALLCLFCSSTSTHAADLKATGTWSIEFLWKDNWNFMNDGMPADFDNGHNYRAMQEFDTSFQFVTSENMKGVIQTRTLSDWGSGGTSIGSTTGLVRVKQAYVDYAWPNSNISVRAGFFPVALPSAIGTSYILNEETSAFTVAGPFTDRVGYLFGYARAKAQADSTVESTRENYQDAYFASFPHSFKGVQFSPFFALANIGKNTGNTVVDGLKPHTFSVSPQIESAWWAGSSFSTDALNYFLIKADFNYGATSAKNSEDQRAGWLGALSVEYDGFQSLTPELFFVYTSGDDATSGKSERMPVLDSGFAVGTYFFGGDWGVDGSIDDDTDAIGFWLAGFSLKGISFANGLSHDIIVMYIQGTNDKDMPITGANNVKYGRTLTEKDFIWEIDLNSEYALYDELTAYVQFGWLKADYDQQIWGANFKGGDAYKISVGMAYAF